MTLVTTGGRHPFERFNAALNYAHRIYFATASTSASEPRLVRALIADKTIRMLNAAAASAYDPRHGVAYFRGGYLHASPYANFAAQWPGGQRQCRRELADALFVIYETAPLAPGSPPVVTRRTACMLMFKSESSAMVLTPAFVPGISVLPPDGNSTNEQLYLFNKWPSFKLETGRKAKPNPHGTYNLSGLPQHDIGKYAVVHSKRARSPWNSEPGTKNGRARWLYANPTSSLVIAPNAAPPISGSMGYLLQEMIAGTVGYGRSFNPKAPAIPGVNGWDELMGRLLGFQATMALPPVFQPGRLSAGVYYGQPRDINPSGMQFMAAGLSSWENDVTEAGQLYNDVSTYFEGRPEADFIEWLRSRHAWTRWVHPYHHHSRGFSRIPLGIPPGPDKRWNTEDDDDGLPVLVLSVHHRQPRLDEKPRSKG